DGGRGLEAAGGGRRRGSEGCSPERAGRRPQEQDQDGHGARGENEDREAPAPVDGRVNPDGSARGRMRDDGEVADGRAMRWCCGRIGDGGHGSSSSSGSSLLLESCCSKLETERVFDERSFDSSSQPRTLVPVKSIPNRCLPLGRRAGTVTETGTRVRS